MATLSVDQFKANIKSHHSSIAVIGMGYVGLPLALAFADQGFTVTGIDKNLKLTQSLTQGKSNNRDIHLKQLKDLVSQKKIQFSTDFNLLKKAEIIIICVPTPLDQHGQPNLSYIQDCTAEIKKRLQKGQLIILESTTYPGTTYELIQTPLEQSGFQVEKDFFIAFSPERIDPGNALKVEQITKVVGADGSGSRQLAKTLYEQIIEKVHLVSNAKTAEMVKLLENLFRSVNIAMVNELALLTNRMGIDIWEVIEAAATKPFGFMPFYPGPGIGGHCIPLDPFYLSWKAKEYGFNSHFVELAGEINAMMPHYVLTKISFALNQHQKPLNGSKVLILGAAYKKDISDLRESPALKVIHELQKKKAKVSYTDPFISEINESEIQLKHKKLTPKLIEESDCVVMITPHSEFDLEMIFENATLIVDTRNSFKGYSSQKIFKI